MPDCSEPQEEPRPCTCTYMSCGNRGACCDCLHSHLAKRQLPGCCFPADVEKTYDRSFEAFIRCVELKPALRARCRASHSEGVGNAL